MTNESQTKMDIIIFQLLQFLTTLSVTFLLSFSVYGDICDIMNKISINYHKVAYALNNITRDKDISLTCKIIFERK